MSRQKISYEDMEDKMAKHTHRLANYSNRGMASKSLVWKLGDPVPFIVIHKDSKQSCEFKFICLVDAVECYNSITI